MTKSIVVATLLGGFACARGHNTADAGVPNAADAGAGADAGAAAPPDALWSIPVNANLFSRALDISCAPPGAASGVEGCIALLRYYGELDGDAGLPDSATHWGSVLFVRLDAAGRIVWQRVLMSGFDPIANQWGAFVDDDFRVHMLTNGEFLVSTSYEGRVFAGEPGDPKNEEFGPATNRNVLLIEFHTDGEFDNWEDTGNGKELHALSAVELPDTNLVLAGSCQGDVPLDTGSVPCGDSPSGYLLTTTYDGSTVGGMVFGGTPTGFNSEGLPRPTQALDLTADDANNVFVSGSFERDMTYPGNTQDVAVGMDDAFLMKVAPDLTRTWILTAGSLGHDRGGHLARVPGGVLWTALVSSGANLAGHVFQQGGHIVAFITDAGKVSWVYPVPGAHGTAPLGVASASDGSFALYGDAWLARYSAAGTLQWERTDADARGASFTASSLVVAASAIGTQVFDVTVAASGPDVPRSAVVAFPR